MYHSKVSKQWGEDVIHHLLAEVLVRPKGSTRDWEKPCGVQNAVLGAFSSEMRI